MIKLYTVSELAPSQRHVGRHNLENLELSFIMLFKVSVADNWALFS